MAKWVDEIPPIQQPMRYGNKAFKDWVDKVGRAPLLSPLSLRGCGV